MTSEQQTLFIAAGMHDFSIDRPTKSVKMIIESMYPTLKLLDLLGWLLFNLGLN